ncbi:MAG: ankyrin repeat domain-containing protein [Parachlamydiaceae bacterium]
MAIDTTRSRLIGEIRELEQKELVLHSHIDTVDLKMRENDLVAQLTRSHLNTIEELSQPNVEQIRLLDFFNSIRPRISRIRLGCLENYNSFIKARDSFVVDRQFIRLTPEKKRELQSSFEISVAKTIAKFEETMDKQHHLGNLESLKNQLEEERKNEIKEQLRPELDRELVDDADARTLQKRLLSLRLPDGLELYQQITAADAGRTVFEKERLQFFDEKIKNTLARELERIDISTNSTLTDFHLKAITTILTVPSDSRTLRSLETLILKRSATPEMVNSIFERHVLEKEPALREQLTRELSNFDVICPGDVRQKRQLQVSAELLERDINTYKEQLEELNAPSPAIDSSPDRWTICSQGVLRNLQAVYANKSFWNLRFINAFNYTFDRRGTSMLHIACSNNYSDIVDWLITQGADVSRADLKGDCPIHAATRKQSLTVVKTLVDHGASVDQKQGLFSDVRQAPMHIAAINGSIDIIEFLLSKEADPNIQDSNGDTPLHYAVINNQQAVVSLLMGHTKAQKLADFLGVTRQERESFELTIRDMKEITPIAQNRKKHTPFYYAVKFGFDNLLTSFIDSSFCLPLETTSVDYKLFRRPPKQNLEAVRAFLVAHGGADHLTW